MSRLSTACEPNRKNPQHAETHDLQAKTTPKIGVMTDTFARATARRAHTTSSEALELAKTALNIAHDTHQRAVIRPRQFVGLCALCGEACKHTSRYCHTHLWAA